MMYESENRCLSDIDEQVRIVKQFLMQQALRYGPSVARVVEHIWADSIQEAYQDARELMRLSYRYGSARLEKACERSLYYRHHRNSSTIGWILEKDYDRLVLSPHIDLRGEFIYSFEPLTPEDQNNVESRIPRDKMAE